MSLASKNSRLPLVLLALPALSYLWVAWTWHSLGLYKINGDEPHYLLVSDSLVTDGDLLPGNNYLVESPVSEAYGAQLPGHLVGEYSFHGIGLPLILALPYELGGVLGAKIAQTLLVGLTPLALFQILRRITEVRLWSILVALTVGLGLPFLASANQIFPDNPGGLIIIFVFGWLLGVWQGEPIRWRGVIAASLALAFLPWLHMRFAAPAVILACATLTALYLRMSPSARSSQRSLWLVHLLAPAIILVASLLVLIVYNLISSGEILGPLQGSLSYDPSHVAMVFLGLHWDRVQGQFFQHPFLLLALVGVIPLFRADWRVGLIWLMLYLSLVVPNSMQIITYGGGGFVGRFAWAATPLWVVPLAYTIRLLLQIHWGLVFSLCAVSVLLQIQLARDWLYLDRALYPAGLGINFWLGYDFFSRLLPMGARGRYMLPSFQDFEHYTFHLPNYLFLIFGIALLLTGWLYKRSWFTLFFLPVLVLAGLAVLITMPAPPPQPVVLTAAQLYSDLGTIDGSSRLAEPGKSGWFLYGPFFDLLPGERYQVALYYHISPAAVPVSSWDITVDRSRLRLDSGALPLTGSDGVLLRQFTFPRLPPILDPQFQFRVWYGGEGELTIDRLELSLVADDEP